MRNSLKIRRFAILSAVECHDGKEICPAQTNIVQHDSILFIVGAIHRTLPTVFKKLVVKFFVIVRLRPRVMAGIGIDC